jgi:hypothetical protein
MILAVLLLATAAHAATFIRANQLGYAINDGKVAIALSTAPMPAEFSLVAENNDGLVFFRGKTRPVAGGWGNFRIMRSWISPRCSRQGDLS